MKDDISKALNMLPLNSESIPLKHPDDDRSFSGDSEIARENIHTVISTGLDAMSKLSQIADQSQHPRAFEVLSGLMKTILDANKDLLEIHKTKKSMSEPTESTKNVTNNLYVGSTADLQKLIEDKMKNGE